MADAMDHKNPWSAFSTSHSSSHDHFGHHSQGQLLREDDQSIGATDSHPPQETVLFPGEPLASLHNHEIGNSPHQPSLDKRISPEEKGDGATSIGEEGVSEGEVETARYGHRLPEQPHQHQEGLDHEGWNRPAAAAKTLSSSEQQEQQQQQQQEEEGELQKRSHTSLADSAVAFVGTDRAALQSTTMGSTALLDQGQDLYRSDSLDSDVGFGSDVWRPSLASSSSPADAEDKGKSSPLAQRHRDPAALTTAATPPQYTLDDVLELLVQKLQSEIADTRATVLDLENRLSAAESTNKHIVEELKMLLADAEGTLIGSDDSDGGGDHGAAGSALKGMEEDANVVYNRICNALQTLITDAQIALARTSTNTNTTASASGSTHALPLASSSSSLACSTSGRCNCPPYQHRLYSTSGNLLLPNGGSGAKSSSISSQTDPRGYGLDDKDHPHSHQHHLSHNNSLQPPTTTTSRGSRFTSRRSSLAPPHLYVARGPGSSLYPPAPVHPYLTTAAQQQSEEFSRIRWKEKQQEQYDRYRRSCDRVTLELELLLRDTWRAVYDEEAEAQHAQQQLQQQQQQQQHYQQQHYEQQQHLFSWKQQRASRQHSRSYPFSSLLSSPSSGASTVVPSLAGSPTAANAPMTAQGYEGESDKLPLTSPSQQQQQQQDISAKAQAMKARLEKIQRLQRQYLSLSQTAYGDMDENNITTFSKPLHPLEHHHHHQHQYQYHSNIKSPSSRNSSSSSTSSSRTITSMPMASSSSSTALPTCRRPTPTRTVATMPDSSRHHHDHDQTLLVVQLYRLWRQTALRARLMHTLTTLAELLLASWVLLKLAQYVLTACGVQYRQGWNDLQRYLYGDREGAAAATAKELYLRIRADSARRRRLVEWRRKSLLSARWLARWLTLDLSRDGAGGTGAGAGAGAGTGTIAGAAADALVSSISQAAVQDEEIQSRAMRAMIAYPSSRMLTDPVRRVAGHVVSGLLLALVVNQAKRLSRRL
ncbi:hypothetical protein DFQ27_002305 [Actinomortierella ambigua]|uniref:Uncharacterized protein n=1 Tax=Actinomortierella ambigua TaxID=1343610 RepID=A0A9P6QBV1_9FUNG|nr:hypothetical protein DFQ27_002305 [Actinomortierella ambigua]